jgi:hypothetical protein
MQRAFVQFLEKAFSQYGEETQRLMRLTQGAVEEAAHIAQDRIDGTNGNATASEASGSEASTSMPSSMKRASPSHRHRA